MIVKAVIDAVEQRGYTEDPARPPSCSRPPAARSPTPTGRFFVKENAFTYGPPAGTAARSTRSSDSC